MTALRIVLLLALGALFACSEAKPSPMLEAGSPETDGSTAAPPDAGDQPADGSMVGPSDGSALEDAGDSGAIDPVLDSSIREDADAGPDAGPSCDSDCPEDDVRCSDDAIERCVRDADGCLAWLSEQPCEGAAPLCVQTEESARCEAPLPSCTDDVQNQDETDADCGGTVCERCGIGESCETPSDCALGTCTDGVCAPFTASCTDLFARPTGFAAPNSLPWPLISKETGQPRRAIGTTFGEYQVFNETYLHTGIDIRGAPGDYVKVVADGNVWLTANLAECEDNAGATCRLYVRSTSGRYIYYYSHLLFSSSDPITSLLRWRIMLASPQGSDDYAVRPGTEVSAGETLSGITNFPAWAHLHFGIFDAQQNYDGVNPLLALELDSAEPPIIDDEPPSITPPRAFVNDTMAALSVDRCVELSGSIDLKSESTDAFYTTDPVPERFISGVSNNGIYAAELFIRHVASGSVEQRTWYDMSSVPFDCVGPLRGAQCAMQLDEAGFLARSVNEPTGAAHVGSSLAHMLFDMHRSTSDYLGIETHQLILTHSWGESGAWNTASGPDGVYQLSVEVRDHAGNKSAATRFSTIDNSGTFEPATSTPDAYVRDSARDIGAIPSSLGDQPTWTSPDIFVVPAGAPVTVESEPAPIALSADATYDVYVRVRNDGCSPIDDVRVRLRAAPPDLGIAHLLLSEQHAITGPSSFVGDATNPDGLDLPAASAGLLGPFAFTPTSALVASTSSAALYAEIDAPNDPRDAAASTALDNNLAVRSVGLAATAAAPAFYLSNPASDAACVQLLFERVGLPVADIASEVVLVVPNDPIFTAAWAAVPGTAIELVGETLRIELLRARVALPPVVLPSGARFEAQVELHKPASSPDAAVRFSQYTAGVLTGGVELH